MVFSGISSVGKEPGRSVFLLLGPGNVDKYSNTTSSSGQ